MIYNQGFEVIILGRKFFAFSLYKKNGTTVESLCDATFPGWVHDVDQRNWGCYIGEKSGAQSRKTMEARKIQNEDKPFRMSESFIAGLI